MGSDPAKSYLLAVITFLAGIAVGWLLATIHRKGRIDIPVPPVGIDSGAGKRRTRTIEIKCGCGALLKFRDPAEPGYQPYPSSDSITCPNCGRVKNLKEIRKLEKDAQA